MRGSLIVSFVLLFLSLAQHVLSQSLSPNGKSDPSGPKKSTSPSSAVATPQKPSLTIEDVMKMVEAKVPESIIVAKVKKNETPFDLNPDQLIALKKAGGSDDMIEVLMDPARVWSPPPAPASARPSETTSSAPPLGSSAAQATLYPSEIGVYAKKSNTWAEVLPEVVNWKTGGVLKSIGTAGIVKGDINGHIEGPTSHNLVKTPLEFLIYAPEGVAITEYQFLRLRANKDSREFRTVTGGVLHVKGGATRDLVPFESKKLAPRMYQVILPTTVSTGEYGFLPPGAYGSANSASSMGKIYTVHILE